MRATLLLLSFFLFSGLFLWVALSGALFVFGLFLLGLVIVITLGYSDTMVLFLLGAREIRSSDEKAFFEAASQEAYKLAVPMPTLYFYNGTLERAFILQKRKKLSIVLNKDLLRKASADELKAICFELLLQVKKKMASKRTKVMFILGFMSWTFHSMLDLFLRLLPFREVRRVLDWILNYFLHPLLSLLFKLIMGEGYFKKLDSILKTYEKENQLLSGVGLKLDKPYSYYSLPSRKILEFSSVSKSRHFQNILALEFLPHEWDYFFRNTEIKSAE